MSTTIIQTKLHDLAKMNRLAGKHTLADTLDETAEILGDAENLIRDFPVLIVSNPGKACRIGATDSAEYAHRLGEWMRRRDAFLEKGSKK